MSTPRAKTLDCGALLDFVINAEQCVASSAAFGHKDPPHLCLHHDLPQQKDLILIVAYTKHVVAAQLVAADPSKHATTQPPLHVCAVPNLDYEDQRITALQIVPLENKTWTPKSLLSENVVMDDGDTSTDSFESASEVSPIKDGSTALSTNTPQNEEHIANDDISSKDVHRLAIVLGTNLNQVFTVELVLDRTNNTPKLEHVHVMDNDSTMYQVFPTDVEGESLQQFQKRRRKGTPTAKGKPDTHAPFQPTGGITSIQLHKAGEESARMWCWIMYGDGTMLRASTGAFFPSQWSIAVSQRLSVEDFLIKKRGDYSPLVRCKVELPPSPSGQGRVLVLPLPRYHPSPLAFPVAPHLLTQGTKDNTTMSGDRFPGEFEAIVFGLDGNDFFPTVCFYTSENQMPRQDFEEHEETFQSTEESTTAVSSIAKSFVGSAFSALKRGFLFGGRNERHDEDGQEFFKEEMTEMKIVHEDSSGEELPSSPFPSIWRTPLSLFANGELHDAPRRIESCTIDPEGRFAATCDCLGRVLLIDLATKQTIRMWKGCRDATCFWLHGLVEEGPSPSSLYQGSDQWRHSSAITKARLFLVIHTRQRRTVEVWPLRHGNRIHAVQVGRAARVIPFAYWSAAASRMLEGCYLIKSISSSDGAKPKLLELLNVSISSSDVEPPQVEDNASISMSIASMKSHVPPSNNARRDAQRLQHLQQLLSAADAAQFTLQNVRAALYDIQSLADLANALDFLSLGRVLEERLGVVGASFHKEVIEHCTKVLNSALHRGQSRNDMTATNPHVQLLSHKLQYHTQISKAYDTLAKFEKTRAEFRSQPAKTLSHWAAEGMAWASTQAQINSGFEENQDPKREHKHLLFSDFAAACTFPTLPERQKQSCRVYFSESTRTRRDALEYIFRPLCGDLFSFNVVYSVFDNLGIRDDCEYIEKCFSEWFMTLSIEDCYQKGLQAENPPMTRLLQDLVARQLVVGNTEDNAVGLAVVHSFCTHSEDLVRSFILCVLCLDAVQRATSQKEKSSYGKICSVSITDHWRLLLRKIRVCLLVSFRMYGVRLAAPITVSNVEDPSLFSVHEWVARDELSVSIHNDEVALLENACIMSSHGFDPSLPEGDGPAKFKVLQSSCLAAIISENERAEYLVDIDRYGVLLLFLTNYRNQTILAAHRVLLLAADWGSDPSRLELLDASIDALKSFECTHPALASSVCFEVWQSRLCPIYRAHLLGFDDVQEVSEDVIGPLLENRAWFLAIGRMGLRFLQVLKHCNDRNVEEDLLEPLPPLNDQSWPPVRPDCVLQRIQKKMPEKVDKESLDAHGVVLCSFLVSGDLETLLQCMPIYDMFQSPSLFKHISASNDVSELQQKYLMEAIVTFACEYDGEPMEDFELNEIEAIANVWNMELKTVRVNFLRAMYELGHDKKVDQLTTTAAALIDVRFFVDAGVDIVCHRLDTFLGSRQARNVLSLLDADVCSWIHQRRLRAPPSLVEKPNWSTSIGDTHLLIMRLLSLSAGANIESPARSKIHSLVVMSGILVKSLVETSATIS